MRSALVRVCVCVHDVFTYVLAFTASPQHTPCLARLLMLIFTVMICADEVVAIKTITIIEPPVVDAGTGFSFCEESNQFTISDASINGAYTGISWTTNGSGGSLTGDSSLTPTYIPSAQDYINGSVLFTMEVSGNGTCPV